MVAKELYDNPLSLTGIKGLTIYCDDNDIELTGILDSSQIFGKGKKVIIPKGKKLTIKKGGALLFDEFTTFHVLGSLKVEGTIENPVVFSSINDSNYNKESKKRANTFDWNGIVIAKEAEDIDMKNFNIMYTTQGLITEKEDIPRSPSWIYHAPPT